MVEHAGLVEKQVAMKAQVIAMLHAGACQLQFQSFVAKLQSRPMLVAMQSRFRVGRCSSKKCSRLCRTHGKVPRTKVFARASAMVQESWRVPVLPWAEATPLGCKIKWRRIAQDGPRKAVLWAAGGGRPGHLASCAG